MSGRRSFLASVLGLAVTPTLAARLLPAREVLFGYPVVRVPTITPDGFGALDFVMPAGYAHMRDASGRWRCATTRCT